VAFNMTAGLAAGGADDLAPVVVDAKAEGGLVTGLAAGDLVAG
jgi:hypothetical protein